jgi:hypothetical protein
MIGAGLTLIIREDATHSTGGRRLEAITGSLVKVQTDGRVSRLFPGIRRTPSAGSTMALTRAAAAALTWGAPPPCVGTHSRRG